MWISGCWLTDVSQCAGVSSTGILFVNPVLEFFLRSVLYVATGDRPSYSDLEGRKRGRNENKRAEIAPEVSSKTTSSHAHSLKNVAMVSVVSAAAYPARIAQGETVLGLA